MLGAIAGDVIGSIYEYNAVSSSSFPLFSDQCRFTDDTVMLVAVADVLLHGGDYGQAFRQYARRYPDAGYGRLFHQWAFIDETIPYQSFGNGSAMRVAPIAWVGNSLEEILALAEKTALPTHNHPEGIKGAQAMATCVYLARTKASKKQIQQMIAERFSYDMNRTLSEIQEIYYYDETCQGSVPEAIIAFLEAPNFEESIRNAIMLRGDADTQAAMAGGIAEAFFVGVPNLIAGKTFALLDDPLRGVVEEFRSRYGIP